MWQWVCVIQWCWLSGITLLCIDTPPECHIQPHFKMSVLPLCASLWMSHVPAAFFLSSFSLVWLVKQCLPHPVVWSSALSLFLSKCQLLKEDIFLFLLWKHRGCSSSSSSPSPPTLALSLTVLLCDVLTTNSYILRYNSIPWGHKPAQTGSVRFDCALFPGQK